MPDTSHRRERVDEFERFAGTTRGGRKGGVLLTRNKKAFTVNIRPQRWSNKYKFWIGKITNLELAKFLADTIFHYLGKSRCHFGDAPFPFPRLACMGIYDTSRARRFAYVKAIAGNGCHLDRTAFIQEVLHVIESQEFKQERERFLNLRNVQAAAHPLPIDEAAPDNPSPSDEAASDPSSPADEAGGDECETPFEDDPEAVAMARALVASPQVATVAGFAFNVGTIGAGGPGKILESVEQPLGSECYNVPSAVEKKDWNIAIDELNMNSAMAAGSSAASNAMDRVPQPVFDNISFLPGTTFIAVDPVLSLDILEENQLALTPHVQSHGPLSCQPSVNSASLMH